MDVVYEWSSALSETKRKKGGVARSILVRRYVFLTIAIVVVAWQSQSRDRLSPRRRRCVAIAVVVAILIVDSSRGFVSAYPRGRVLVLSSLTYGACFFFPPSSTLSEIGQVPTEPSLTFRPRPWISVMLYVVSVQGIPHGAGTHHRKVML
jgi:hypothetical protein